MNIIKRFFLYSALIFTPFCSFANQQLDQLFKKINTYQANFLQLVEQNGSIIQRSEGLVYLKKPLFFHWDYKTPEAMQFISDGKNLYHYDIDLFQATVKPLSETNNKLLTDLLNSPEKIEETFNVTSLPAKTLNQYINPQFISQAPKQVYLLQKKVSDPNVASIALIGTDANDQFNLLYIKDDLGSNLFVFDDIQQNISLNDSLFTFTAPEGVDVLGDL